MASPPNACAVLLLGGAALVGLSLLAIADGILAGWLPWAALPLTWLISNAGLLAWACLPAASPGNGHLG